MGPGFGRAIGEQLIKMIIVIAIIAFFVGVGTVFGIMGIISLFHMLVG